MNNDLKEIANKMTESFINVKTAVDLSKKTINDLQNELDKYKSTIDIIKEYIEKRSDYFQDDTCKYLLKILEEIE